MKRLLILTTVLLALAAPSAFACQSCQDDFSCSLGVSAWCHEHVDFCTEGGGCFAPAKPITPFNANWQVAAVERLEPAQKVTPSAKNDAPKIASLEKAPATR